MGLGGAGWGWVGWGWGVGVRVVGRGVSCFVCCFCGRGGGKGGGRGGVSDVCCSVPLFAEGNTKTSGTYASSWNSHD